LLFKTADDLYIIKTLEKNEYTFILGILEKYVGHLTRMGGDVNSSLLVKFVGMFSIKKNRKIRLIAMQVRPYIHPSIHPSIRRERESQLIDDRLRMYTINQVD
jgi:hypothetical protein